MKKNKNTSNSVRNLVLTALLAGPVAFVPTMVQALPLTAAKLGYVAAGPVGLVDPATSTPGVTFQINTNNGTVGTLATITTNTDRTVLNWSQFAAGVADDGTAMVLASGQTLNFVQPSATSAVLNKVAAGASVIDGRIASNGRFFLINTAGITVGVTGSIDAPVVALTTQDDDDSGSDYNYFKSYGTLKQISGTNTAAAPTNAVTVSVTPATTTAAISTPGKTGDIYLYGSAVNVAGVIDGNLFVKAKAGAVQLGQGLLAGAADDTGLTVAGNLTSESSGVTNIGAATTTAGLKVEVKGDASIKTTNSVIAHTGAAATALTVKESGKILTLNSGTAAATVSGDFNTVKSTSGALTVTDSTGDIAIGESALSGNLTVTSTATAAGKGNITSAGVVTMSAGTVNLALGGDGVAVGTATFVGKGAITTGTLTQKMAGDTFSIESQDSSIAFGTVLGAGAGGSNITLKAKTSITQGAQIITTGKLSVNGTDTTSSITLGDALNNVSGAILLAGGKAGITIDNSAAATTKIGASTPTGAVTITGVAVQLGTSNDDTLTFGDALTIVSSGNITDSTNNISVTKDLSLTNTGATAVTIDGTNVTVSGKLKGTILGASKVVANAALTAEGLTGGAGSALTLKTTTGGITLKNVAAVDIALDSAAGIAGDSAAANKVLISGTTNLKTAAGSSVDLTNALNSFAGVVTIGADTTDVALTNVVATTLNTAAGKKVTGNLTITAKTAGASAVTVGGADGGGTFGNFNSVAITMPSAATGAISVKDADGVSIKDLAAPGTGTVSIETKNGAIAFGAGVNVTTSAATTITAGGADANITQGTDAISITGPVTFASAKGLTLANTGNKFGALSLTTGGDGSASVTEGEAIVLDQVTIDGKGSLTVNAGSNNITQSGAASFVKASGSTTDGSVSFTGKNVTLDKTYVAIATPGNNIAKPVSFTTTESVTFAQGMSDLKLGKLSVGKDLTVDSTGTANNAFVAITEDAAGQLWVYGKTTLKSNNTTIDLSNTGNNFGPIFVDSGSGDIKITEASTMNIRRAVGAGNAALRSELGDIIDTSDKDVATEVITLNTSGKETKFTAEMGAVTIDSNTANSVGLRNVFVSAKNDSKIVSLGNAITLSAGTSVTAGSFSLTTGNQNIGSAGKVSVFGPATFDAGTGDISLTNTGNSFGVLKLLGDDATVFETSSINLAPATSLTGVVSLTSDDQIVTLGTGVVNLTRTGANGTSAWDVTLKATNGITLSTGWFVKGKLKLDSAAMVDLGALSIAGNLNGNTPTYTGTVKVEPKP